MLIKVLVKSLLWPKNAIFLETSEMLRLFEGAVLKDAVDGKRKIAEQPAGFEPSAFWVLAHELQQLLMQNLSPKKWIYINACAQFLCLLLNDAIAPTLELLLGTLQQLIKCWKAGRDP